MKGESGLLGDGRAVGGEGLFGLEDKADEIGRQAKLRSLAEQIAQYDREYEGSQRRCPRRGQMQRYKGESSARLDMRVPPPTALDAMKTIKKVWEAGREQGSSEVRVGGHGA